MDLKKHASALIHQLESPTTEMMNNMISNMIIIVIKSNNHIHTTASAGPSAPYNLYKIFHASTEIRLP